MIPVRPINWVGVRRAGAFAYFFRDDEKKGGQGRELTCSSCGRRTSRGLMALMRAAAFLAKDEQARPTCFSGFGRTVRRELLSAAVWLATGRGEAQRSKGVIPIRVEGLLRMSRLERESRMPGSAIRPTRRAPCANVDTYHRVRSHERAGGHTVRWSTETKSAVVVRRATPNKKHFAPRVGKTPHLGKGRDWVGGVTTGMVPGGVVASRSQRQRGCGGKLVVSGVHRAMQRTRAARSAHCMAGSTKRLAGGGVQHLRGQRGSSWADRVEGEAKRGLTLPLP